MSGGERGNGGGLRKLLGTPKRNETPEGRALVAIWAGGKEVGLDVGASRLSSETGPGCNRKGEGARRRCREVGPPRSDVNVLNIPNKLAWRGATMMAASGASKGQANVGMRYNFTRQVHQLAEHNDGDDMDNLGVGFCG